MPDCILGFLFVQWMFGLEIGAFTRLTDKFAIVRKEVEMRHNSSALLDFIVFLDSSFCRRVFRKEKGVRIFKV